MNELALMLRQSKGMTVRVFCPGQALVGVIHEVGVEILVLKSETSSLLVSDGYLNLKLESVFGFEILGGK